MSFPKSVFSLGRTWVLDNKLWTTSIAFALTTTHRQQSGFEGVCVNYCHTGPECAWKWPESISQTNSAMTLRAESTWNIKLPINRAAAIILLRSHSKLDAIQTHCKDQC